MNLCEFQVRQRDHLKTKHIKKTKQMSEKKSRERKNLGTVLQSPAAVELSVEELSFDPSEEEPLCRREHSFAQYVGGNRDLQQLLQGL